MLGWWGRVVPIAENRLEPNSPGAHEHWSTVGSLLALIKEEVHGATGSKLPAQFALLEMQVKDMPRHLVPKDWMVGRRPG